MHIHVAVFRTLERPPKMTLGTGLEGAGVKVFRKYKGVTMRLVEDTRQDVESIDRNLERVISLKFLIDI